MSTCIGYRLKNKSTTNDNDHDHDHHRQALSFLLYL